MQTGSETGFNYFLTRAYLFKKYFKKLVLMGFVVHFIFFMLAIVFLIDSPVKKGEIIIKFYQAKAMDNSPFFKKFKDGTIDIKIQNEQHNYAPASYIYYFQAAKVEFLHEFRDYLIYSATAWFLVLLVVIYFRYQSKKLKSDQILKGSEILSVAKFNKQNKDKERFVFEIAKDAS